MTTPDLIETVARAMRERVHQEQVIATYDDMARAAIRAVLLAQIESGHSPEMLALLNDIPLTDGGKGE